ncbi:cytochrome P450-dit2 [Ceratobasidium sp. 423]|nr:cytochrome P450-dit2 [Ceratobasidium sp. 423]
MSNSTVPSFASLRSLLDAALQSEGGASGLELLASLKDHSTELGFGLLGLLSARSIYQLVKRSTTFRELDGPTPNSFLWGDEALMFSPETSLTAHEELLNKYGSVCKIKGMLGEDRLWIADPRAMNDIILKSYDSFHEPEAFLAWIRLTSGNHLLVTNGKFMFYDFAYFIILWAQQPKLTKVRIGHKHKMQRKILNPLEDIIASKAQANGGNTGIVDIYTLMSNVALEMVGQAGMGYSFGVLENKEPEYLKASLQLLMYLSGSPLINALWYVRPFLATLMKFGPAGFRRAIVDRLPSEKVQELKSVADVLDNTAVDIYQRKKRALANGTLESEIAAGHDIISMLLKQNEVVPPEEQMTEEEIIAHVNLLVFAGHDTTSGALARTFYLLAQYPDIQDRVREEVREAHRLYGRDLDYDQLNSLPFLDAVCRESLRLWTPAQMVERVACVDYNLPLQHPVKSRDGKATVSNLYVPKGTHMYLSLGSVNRDKQTWGEDADKFNPDRWLKPMPSSVSESKIPGVYSNIMTFLGGPRACLGFKFSQLEMKVVFSLLISSFKFELGNEDIGWTASGIVKPVIQRKDGTMDLGRGPTLPMKITVLEHGRDNKLHFWRLTPAAPLLADAASMPNLSKPTLVSSMDVNALNYCRFSLYPVQSDPPRALLALPNLIESELIDVWELPGRTRIHAAVGTIKGAPTRKPFSDEGRDIYKTGIVMSLHISQTETYMRILAGYESGTVTLWTRPLSGSPRSIEGNGWNKVWSVKNHLEAVMGMAVSRDNTMAASVSADHLICRYDLRPELDADAAQLAPHETKHLGSGAVGFQADGRVLGVAGWDGAVRLYSTGLRRGDGVGANATVDRNRKVRSLGTLEHFKESCFAMAFANEVIEDMATLGPEDEDRNSLEALKARSRWLAVGGKTGRVAIWELDSFEKR